MTTLWAQLSSQFSTCLVVLSTQFVLYQLVKDNVVGHCCKCLAQIKTDDIHSLSCICWAKCFITEDDRVSQAWLSLVYLCSLFPNHFLVLHVHGNNFPKDLFRNFPRDGNEADCSVVSQTLLFVFSEYGCDCLLVCVTRTSPDLHNHSEVIHEWLWNDSQVS